MVNLNEDILRAHQEAAINAKEQMPELDVIALIKLAVQCASKQISVKDAALQLCDEYSPAFEAYMKAFTPAVVKSVFDSTGDENIQRLGNGVFNEMLCKKADEVYQTVQKYLHGDIDKAQFIDTLMHSDMTDIGKEFLRNFNIDMDTLVNPDGTPVNFSSPVVGYLALSSAYMILMKSLKDASIAYEHRLAVEEECRQSVELIVSYRQQMEENVSKYMSERLETIEHGFAEMDQALLRNDTDGFIRGNTEIQKLLNYDIQFTNQEEFDDLMDSDLTFKL